ncbi:hypothetical protein F4778DRAFT_700078 [Xylariomycetidae sp. FL2044]|nr:hypothetical protein F4778DRAFT_700078 [Xylariomycetidae sp. FL2044]
MKTSTVAAALVPSSAALEWFDGAPACGRRCLSSAWGTNSASGTVTSWWPAQSEYCDTDKGNSVADCFNSACASTSTAFSSYSSLSSSLCSQYESCTSAGSTGVQTLTYAGGPVTWAAPGGWGGNGKARAGAGPGAPGDPGVAASLNASLGGGGQWGGPSGSDYSHYWSEWASAAAGSKTWTGGAVTITGCAFQGSPWFVGPDCGWNEEGGFNGWVGWGAGWSWGPTQTQTVTVTTTDSAGQQTTETGLATVALAVSGSLTTSTTLGALATSTSGSGDGNENGAASARLGGGAEGSAVTLLMGFALGAVVLVAGML